MSCPHAEEVALLESAGPELRAHLAGCAECRELLDDLLSDQALLREPPTVPEGVVAKAVLRRLAVRRWSVLPAGLAAAAALAFVILRPLPVPQTLALTPPAPAVAGVVTPSRKVERRHPAPRPRITDPTLLMANLKAMLQTGSTATASADTSVLITTQTDDPDVVIVLVPENTVTGDGQ
ncbi:MAG: hypothetical protein SGI92_03245 [Bryobacteraceae bacterium]|nr:hypothetical protein [Bryobacteraceae bacterium]